ncbi:MAG: YwqJ-related putative deaminase [Gammaproteobacteria bacterium]|nr:YwqJ-related putative deaminase [Gammaproteobacteria bacterium]
MDRVKQIVEPEEEHYDSSKPLTGNQSNPEELRQFRAEGITTSQYNAFGQVKRQSQLSYVNPLTAAKEWIHTDYYYDNRGNRIAEVNVMGYLTIWQYGAMGNVTEYTEYAQALSQTQRDQLVANDYAKTSDFKTYVSNNALSRAEDRTTATTYTLLNKQETVTQKNVEYSTPEYGAVVTNYANQTGDLTTKFDYDDLGRMISTTDPAGATTRTYYDVLGRTVAVIEPERATESTGAVRLPGLSVMPRYLDVDVKRAEFKSGNSFYTWLGENEVRLKWQDLTSLGEGQVKVQVDYSRAQAYGYESGNYVWDSGWLNNSDAKEGASFSWLPNTSTSTSTNNKIGSVKRVQVWKKIDGVEVLVHDTNLPGYDTNKDGIQSHVLTWEKAPIEGTEVYLEYRRLGEVDANGDLVSYDVLSTASDVLESRIDTKGGVYWIDLENWANDRYEYRLSYMRPGESDAYAVGVGAFEVTNQVSTEASQNVVGVVDRPYLDVDVKRAEFKSGNAFYTWLGENEVRLKWQDLTSLGNGQVKVQVDYSRAQAYGYESGNYVWNSGWLNNSDAKEGASFSWLPNTSTSTSTNNKIGSVKRVQVWKKVNGADVLVHDTNRFGYDNNRNGSFEKLNIFLPVEISDTTLNFAYWPENDPATKQAIEATRMAPGWYQVDATLFAAGRYGYEFSATKQVWVYDGYGYFVSTSVATYKGEVTLSKNGELFSDSIDSLPIPNSPKTSQVLDRWGNVVSVVGAEGYAMIENDTSYYSRKRSAMGLSSSAAGLSEAQKQSILALYTQAYSYNYLNQVTEKTGPATDIYREDGTLETLPDKQRPTEFYYYNKQGQQVVKVDANNYITASQYNMAGLLTREYRGQRTVNNTVKLDGGIVKTNYDAFGRKVTRTNANGHNTDYTYDRNNQLIKERTVLEGGANSQYVTTQYTYDEAGNRTSVTNGEGETTRNFYDGRGNLIRTQLPSAFGNPRLQQNIYYSYDANNKKISELGGNGDYQTWKYDAFNRPLEHRNLGGATYEYTYDNLGQLALQTNSNGQILRYEYYENGALKRIVDDAIRTETFYEYDITGNRIRERYTDLTNNTIHQDVTIEFDQLGRVSRIGDTKHETAYFYDASGNRKRATSTYYLGNISLDIPENISKLITVVSPSEGKTDFYYSYDAMNRITVSQGVKDPVTGQIVISENQGVELSYDAEGNRSIATTFEDISGTMTQVTDSYVYTANNLIKRTFRGGQPNWIREYDLAGRQRLYSKVSTANQSEEMRETVYDEDGRIQLQKTYKGTGSTYEGKVAGSGLALQTTVSYDYPGAYDVYGNNYKYTFAVHVGTRYTNTYETTYAKFDSYKEEAVNGTSTILRNGSTTSTYDVNGNLIRILDEFNKSAERNYVVNTQGQILSKSENGNWEYYYYANSSPVGSIGVDSDGKLDVDFDYNYTPVSETYPRSTPGQYVVNAGDSLQSIALAVYGDSRLWYLIADANGIQSNANLVVGQTLKIPNNISNLHNTADTYRPFNFGEVIGDTSPTLPEPVQPGIDKCKRNAIIIIVIIITIVVSIYATPAVGSKVGAAMLGAFVGGLVGQMLYVRYGFQDKIDWKSLAVSTIAAGITAGMASGAESSLSSTMAQAALSSVVTQGLRVAMGLQEKFDWKGVAISVVMAGISYGMDGGATNAGSVNGASWEGFAGDFLKGVFKGVIRQQISMKVYKEGEMDMSAIAADAFGTAMGNALGASAMWNSVPDDIIELKGDYRQQYLKHLLAGVDRDTASSLVHRGANLDRVGGSINDREDLIRDTLKAHGAKDEEVERALSLLNKDDVLGKVASAQTNFGIRASRNSMLANNSVLEPKTMIPGAPGGLISDAPSPLQDVASDAADALEMLGEGVIELSEMLDSPFIKYALMAVDVAMGPVRFAIRTAIENSSIGKSIEELQAWAFDKGTELVSKQTGRDKESSAKIMLGTIAVGTLAIMGGMYLRQNLPGMMSRFKHKLNLIMRERFGRRLNSEVDAEAKAKIAINDLDGVAISKSGIPELNIKSKTFENIPFSLRKGKTFPGTERFGDEKQFMRVTDPDKYVDEIARLYAKEGNELNPIMRDRIREHVDGGVIYAFKDDKGAKGLPGLHAEVQSANDVLNQVRATPGFDVGRVQVSTYKLQDSPGQGAPFTACNHCSGILDGFDILTGK